MYMHIALFVALHINPRGQKGSLYIFLPLGIPELQLAVDPLGGS